MISFKDKFCTYGTWVSAYENLNYNGSNYKLVRLVDDSTENPITLNVFGFIPYNPSDPEYWVDLDTGNVLAPNAYNAYVRSLETNFDFVAKLIYKIFVVDDKDKFLYSKTYAKIINADRENGSWTISIDGNYLNYGQEVGCEFTIELSESNITIKKTQSGFIKSYFGNGLSLSGA